MNAMEYRQQELMGEGTEHSDSTVPSAPRTRWPRGKTR